MKLIQSSIKSFVVSGFIESAANRDKVFLYKIINEGISITQIMSSDYSYDYSEIQKEIIIKIGDISFTKLKQISKKKGW